MCVCVRLCQEPWKHVRGQCKCQTLQSTDAMTTTVFKIGEIKGQGCNGHVQKILQNFIKPVASWPPYQRILQYI